MRRPVMLSPGTYWSVAMLLLVGCTDHERSPVAAVEPLRSTVSAVGQSAPDLVVHPRFEISLEVEGALKPGQPIHLTLRGSARYATRDAEIRLILPEVAAAQKSSWELVEVPVGAELPPQFQMRKGFAAGEQFRERTTITIPEPGYYYVLATVIQHSEDQRTDGGYVIGAGAGREMWLWVDQHGGRITDRFEPALFPEGTRRIRGPLGPETKPPRTRNGGAVITCTLLQGSLVVSSSPCPQPDSSLVINPPPPPPPGSIATAAVTVTYSDAGTGGTTRPLVDAWVVWKVVNTVTNAQVGSGSGYTNASGGSPTVDCVGPTNERQLQVTVYTENRKTEVTSHITSNAVRTLAGQYVGACGGSIPITADNQQAHLFMNLNKTYDRHQGIFGTPPTIMRAGLYPITGAGTRYDWGARDIHIEPVWDHIWGEMGVMTAAHEWGHLWQDQYLYQAPASDGLKRYYNFACPQRHPPGEYTNFGCAWGEAFADWYAVVVRESDLPGWRRDLEENRLHHLHCGLKCSDDGSIVQGAVSAFMWDITDPAFVEGHDRVQLRPADVVASIKGCEASVDRVQYRPYTGIDHLIWCMERRFPYQVRMQTGTGEQLTTFFNTRPANQWANDARGFSIANFSDDFRRLWLVNLYSKRSVVGNIPIFRTILPGEDPNALPPDEPISTCDGTQITCSS